MGAVPLSDSPIEVVSLRRMESGALKALALVKIGAVLVHGVRVVQQDGGPPWVAFPQVPIRKRLDNSGSGWAQTVEITDPELFARIKATVLEAWRAGR